MFWRGLVALVSVLAALAPLAFSQSCSDIKSVTGDIYNVNSISSRQVDFANGDEDLYKASICTNGVGSCGGCAAAGMCQIYLGVDLCYGTFIGAMGMPQGQGVELSYNGGDLGHSGIVRLICDPSGPPLSTTVKQMLGPVLGQSILEVKSSAACPISGGAAPGRVSPGGIILIILLVLCVVYFAGGAVFLKVRYSAEGSEMVPNKEFWMEIPFLVAAGFLYFIGLLKGLCGRS